ncbi:leucine-rich repeat protein [Segatella copri]|uniref:leucine-rich repeat protein n=1 Tax=Segatella copri TaxID=165179 RepID=UPI003F7236EC
MLFCFILHGFAFDYTDENGVTWTCSTTSEYDEETATYKDYATLTGASNYGAEVVVPEKVYDGETAYTVDKLYNTFQNSTITKVTLPKDSIIIDGAFESCSNLKEVINSQYIKKCRNSAFEHTNLTTIDLSGCKFVHGFNGCKNLESVILKVCKTIEKVSFQNCPKLKSLGETSSVTEIGDGAFGGCSSLQSIDLQNCIFFSIATGYGGTFNGCTSLKTVILPKTLTEIPVCFFSGCSALTSFDFSNITSIGRSAFEGTGLTSVVIPASVKDIEDNTFKNCNNLKSVDLGNINSIGESAFEGTGLTSVVIPASVKDIAGDAFKNCNNLKSVDLGNINSIGYSAFEGTGLTSVVIPASVRNIASNTFKNCNNLKSVDLGNINSIGGNAFKNCNNLKSVDLGNINTIGSSAFEGTGLTNVVIPASVQDIADNTFKNCNNLKSVDLGNINTIGSSAFEGCNIDSITIPATISSIGNNAFPGINYITINATKVPSLGSSFERNAVVLVPEEALNAYKTADVWKDFAGQIFAIGTKLDYDVKTTAQDNAPGLLQQLDKNNLNNIVSLKVSGTINGYDIMLFRNKMDNLHHLDLSDADIVANPYEYYEGCCSEDSVLGANAFNGVKHLISIKIPKSIKKIGDNAFNSCSVRDVIFQEKQNIEIEERAFNSSDIANINLPIGSKLGEWCFAWCNKIQNIILPEALEIIPDNCFFQSSLSSVSIPSSVKIIKRNAFNECRLDSVSLPGLTYIGDYAFAYNHNLKELRVPSTLEKIDDGAFSGCNLEKVYAYTVLPISISQGTFSNFSNIALYVPTQSVDNYYLNTQWSQFKEIHEFNEPYKYFYLDKEFTLEDKRFDGTPDIDIKEDGGLKVDGKDNQEAGDVTIKGDGDKGNSGTLITDGNLNAKKMRFDISVSDNKWYFFSFPFDIKLSDTKAPGEYKWKMYDGSIRADQGSGGWVNLPDNEEWLKQGKGYIFQTNKAGTLTLKVTKEKFGQLDANNIMKELDVFPSGNNFDASWNFIGNPQTSYYNVNDLGYEAPITVWNGNSYEAVRPGDDDYTLHPFQAFFVQKPTASSTIEFKAEDRLTKTGSEIRAQETKARRLARGFVPSRMIINLNVSDGSLSDKTRVVFNDKKSRNYEMDCDAAKFMTLTQAPQLYSVEGKGTKFAINERPMGSVQLGFTAKKSGTFTISAVRMDQPMLLKDNVAGITIDLTNGDYEFTSEAGTFNKRFLLTPNSSVTSIADVVKKTGVNILPTEEGIQINGCNGKNVDVYNLNGAQVASSNSDGILRLSAGVYIVKVNGMSTKVMVK